MANASSGRSLSEPKSSAPLQAPAETHIDRFTRELREGGTAQTLLAVVAAWSITLAPAAFARGSSALSTLLALLALIAGLGGPLLVPTRPRLARHIGISAFAALATATWLAASPAIQPGRLDPTRAVIGAVAWGVYALTWRERWQTPQSDTPADPLAPVLQARATLPALSRPLTALGIVIGLSYLTLAWRARDADRALATQAVAIAAATAVITASAVVALARGKRQPGGARRLTPSAVRSLILFALFGLAGLIMIGLHKLP
jgi:hypothetical protein